MAKYRKIPIIVEAIRWNGNHLYMKLLMMLG